MKKILCLTFFLASFLGLKAQLDDLIIVEYVDDSNGSGYYVKICNPTASAINLSNYYIQLFQDGSTSPSITRQLSGNIAAGNCIIAGNTLDGANSTNCSNVTHPLNGQGINRNDALALTFGNGTNWVDMINCVGWDDMPNINGNTSPFYKKKVTRSPDNCYRYTNTSGSGPNSWPKNTSTVISSWTVSNASCISNLNFTFNNPTKSVNVQICDGDSVIIDGNWVKNAGVFSELIPNVNGQGCDTLKNYNVTLLSRSVTNINEAICIGSSVVINGKTYNSLGNFKDTLQKKGNGCDSILNITITQLPYTNGYDTSRLCFGDSIFFRSKFIKVAGDYNDTIARTNQCDSIIRLHVIFRPKNVRTELINICEGETYFAGGQLQSVAGTYVDTFTTTQGCDSIVNTVLTVESKKQKTEQYFICKNETKIIRGITVKKDTSFQLTINNTNACDSVIDVTVSTFKLNAAFNYNVNNGIIEVLNQSANYDFLLWVHNQSDSVYFEDPIFVLDKSIDPNLIKLKVENLEGCVDSIIQEIPILEEPFEQIYIPNVFTPNSDGLNDYFQIKTELKNIDFDIYIFNRWGEQVYQSNTIEFKWDGTYKGNECQTGTYYYVITGAFKRSGRVSILK